MTTIARGDIEVNLNDAEVIAGLRAVDSQFDRTMRKIEHSRAEATIDAKLRPLEQKMDRAQGLLRKWKAERANATIGADTEQFDRKIARVEAYIRRLDHRKATVEMEVKGDRDALKALQRQERELDTLARAAEAASRRQQQAHRQNTIGIRQEAAQVAQLQQQYARLTDRLERITSKRPIGREARAKVELDAASTILQMETLKAKLNALGSHPPIDIKADIDRGAAQRVVGFLANLGNRAAKLSDLTVRLGPFTTSIKGLITALGFLGPTITDLLGAAGALVGTLGAGIAGAATIGAGALVGLGTAGLGLMFSLRNTAAEVKNARTAINAYQKAVQEYGVKSDQAKKQQQQMNNTLKTVSPLARETALGVERFFATWDKHTGPTQRNFGRIAKAGFKALDDLTPLWATRTNQLSEILANNLSKGFKFLGGRQGKSALSSITRDFNEAMPALLQGLGAFGHGFLNFAVQGAHALGLVTNGIDSLGQKFLAFTQRDSFGQTVHGWIMQARDLMRFFGALTRVAVHFFGAGSAAGQEMVKNMTRALNRWDEFLTSTHGHNQVAQGFERAAHGATALWHAIAPLVGAFVMWANNLSPFVTGVLQGISFVSRLTAKLTELVGLGGPLAVLGATMGAMWAVGKIGTFVSFLARIPKILSEIRAAEGLRGMLGALGNVRLGQATGIEAAGRAAAAQMQAAVAAGGAEAAAEIRAAMVTGGAAAAAEEGIGEAAGGAAAASRLILPAGIAATGVEAGAAAEAVGGLTVATGGLILVGAAAAVGLGILASKLGRGKTEVEKLTEALKDNQGAVSADNAVIEGQSNAQDKANRAHRQATASLKELRRELQQAKPGTVEYRDLQLRIFDATQKRTQSTHDAIKAARDQRTAAQSEIDDLQKQIDLTKQRTKARVDESRQAVPLGGRAGGNPQAAAMAQAHAEQAVAEGAAEVAALQDRITAALNSRAAATLNVARAQHNLNALTGANAQAAGALARTNPNLAQSIALKYAAPKNVGDVSSAARRAIGQGVSVKTVLKIVADSSNAEAALRRIRTLEINKKLVRLGITGHDSVLSKLSEIDRKAIRQKIARIIQHGGEPTLSMIQRIIDRQIRDKSFAVRAQTAQAIGAIVAVQNLMASIHDKTVAVNIVQHAVSLGNKKASGRAPGGSERALIGEGRGPEHYIDPAKGIAFKTPGPMVVDLSPSAFIIPTEDAYKQRGRDLLSQAAADLGMHMYKGGKKKKYKKLPIMHDGSITTDYFSAHQSSTRDAYNKYATKTNTLEDQLHKATVAEHRARTPAAKRTAHNRVADIEKELRGRAGAAAKLKRAAEKATREYNDYAGYQNTLEQLTSQMNQAASLYNTTGDPKQLTAWNVLKGQRSDTYKHLVALIKKVDKRKLGTKWQSDLDKILAGQQADQTTADADEAPTGPYASLDDFIKFLGRQPELTGLNTALSLAGLTPGPDDDITAATALQKFYTEILGAAQSTGNQGLIGAAADQLREANSTLSDLTGQGGTVDQSQQAINDQLRQQLYASQRQSAIQEAFISTTLGPGDIGTAQYPNAGSAAANIIIQTLHPADPATLDAIGRAATSGFSYQGSVSSPRERTGM